MQHQQVSARQVLDGVYTYDDLAAYEEHEARALQDAGYAAAASAMELIEGTISPAATLTRPLPLARIYRRSGGLAGQALADGHRRCAH